MKTEIKIPTVGESITEAIISSIMKPSGSYVRADEEILEIETEKVNQVLYAPAAGQITLNVKVEEKVKIGQVIGYVETDAKAPATAAAAPAPTPTPEKKAQAAPPPSSSRTMAEQFIAEIKEPAKPQPKAAAKPAPTPAPAPKKVDGAQVTRKRMSGLRKTIAERLVEVKNKTAMLTTFNEADMTAIMEIRAREQENFTKRYGVKLGFMSFFVKGVVAALKAFPEVNGMIEGDEIVLFNSYDIGVAVSTEKGLMVPVIRGCDALSFGEIEQTLGTFAKKAREGSIAIDDLRGGSFTITNGGVFGSLLSTPILNPPQSAILGMHSIVKRPVAIDDKVVIRPMMYLALSYDHRIIDGKEAVQFLVHLKGNLEDPARLLLDL